MATFPVGKSDQVPRGSILLCFRPLRRRAVAFDVFDQQKSDPHFRIEEGRISFADPHAVAAAPILAIAVVADPVRGLKQRFFVVS